VMHLLATAHPPAPPGARRGQSSARDRNRRPALTGRSGMVLGDADRPPLPRRRPCHGDVAAQADQDPGGRAVGSGERGAYENP